MLQENENEIKAKTAKSNSKNKTKNYLSHLHVQQKNRIDCLIVNFDLNITVI